MKYLLIALLMFTGTPALAQRRIPPPDQRVEDIKAAYERYVYSFTREYTARCAELVQAAPREQKLQVMMNDCQKLHTEIMADVMSFKEFECLQKAIEKANKCPFDDD